MVRWMKSASLTIGFPTRWRFAACGCGWREHKTCNDFGEKQDWVRGRDLNPRPPGYEPGELTAAPNHNRCHQTP